MCVCVCVCVCVCTCVYVCVCSAMLHTHGQCFSQSVIGGLDIPPIKFMHPPLEAARPPLKAVCPPIQPFINRRPQVLMAHTQDTAKIL